MEPDKTRLAEHRRRQRGNLVAVVAVALVLAAGVWLVDRLLAGRRLQNCIEAGHRNCLPLDLPSR